MAGKLGKFQTQSFKGWFTEISKKNHLGSILQMQPQKATNFMVQLLGFHKGKTLDTFLSQFPVKEFETDDEFVWDVIGSNRRNIPLVEARDESGNVIDEDSGMIGAGTAPFYLVFAEEAFADGEYIVGNLNEVYQFRILGGARLEGTNAVYRVELGGGNMNGVPAERLLAGERFSVETAYVESELSRKVGGLRFATPVSMRNEWSTIRIQHKVTGALLNSKLAVGVPFAQETTSGYKTTTINCWMHWVDYEAEVQFSEYKNNAIAFGRSNRNANGEYTNIGKSGGVIKTGAGLFEQMEVANTMYYNTFSLKLLEDALYAISTANLPLNERVFVLKTGERGATQFSKAVKREVSGWLPISQNNPALISKTSSELHKNALSAGFQFTEWQAPNGVVIQLDVDPMYDDPVRNKVIHPEGGVAMSYRYDIFYLGSAQEPNIQKCAIKGQPEYRGYQWGIRNPFTGSMNNDNMSFDEDSAIMHKMTQLGVVVLDPTRTLSLIPAILQG